MKFESFPLDDISTGELVRDRMTRFNSFDCKSYHWILVTFTERVARLMEGSLLGSAGNDAFLPAEVMMGLNRDVSAPRKCIPAPSRLMVSLLQRSTDTASETKTAPSQVSAVTQSFIYQATSDEVFGSVVIPPTGFTASHHQGPHLHALALLRLRGVR